MKYVVYLKCFDVDDRVFRTVTEYKKSGGIDEKSYRFSNGEWHQLDRTIDYNSGFGDSYLWDEITQKEALEHMGLEKWPEGQEPGDDEIEKRVV